MTYDASEPRDAKGKWAAEGISGAGDSVAAKPTRVAASRKHPLYRSGQWETWGDSHGASTRITGEAAKIMGIKSYDTDFEGAHQSPVYQNQARAMLSSIANSPGAGETTYHGFEDTEHRAWKTGSTVTLSLTAASGNLDSSAAYGVKSPEYHTLAEDQATAQRYNLSAPSYPASRYAGPNLQTSQPTVYEFAANTKVAGYSRYTPQEARNLGHHWGEAITAGKFEVTGVREYRDTGYGWNPAVTIVSLRQTHVFNPASGRWNATPRV